MAIVGASEEFLLAVIADNLAGGPGVVVGKPPAVGFSIDRIAAIRTDWVAGGENDETAYAALYRLLVGPLPGKPPSGEAILALIVDHLLTAEEPEPEPEEFEIQIAGAESRADGYFQSSGLFTHVLERIYLGPGAGTPQVDAWVRFAGDLSALYGKTVLEAHIVLHGYNSEDGGPVSVNIQVEDALAPAVPTDVADLNSRTPLANVAWPLFTLGDAWVESPDIGARIQSLLDAGNPTAIMIQLRGSGGSYVVAHSRESASPTFAPKLTVMYTP